MSGKLSESTILHELSLRNISLIGKCENYRTRKQFKCSQGHIWDCTAYDIIERQHQCPECGNLEKLDDSLIDEKVSKLNVARRTANGMRKWEEICRKGNYEGHHTKIGWECVCCHWQWNSTPHDILYRGVGCPLCHVKSETQVLLALKKLLPNVTIKRQVFLCNYDYENKQREAMCDFLLESNDKKTIIEYNGKQHYDLVFFGSSVSQEQAEAKLKKQQFRDAVVNDYCKANNIQLIVIDGRKIHGEKKVQSHIQKLIEDGILKF